VIVPSAIRPLPIEELAEGARRSGRVVIVEEGPRIGGWGSEVAAELGERLFGVLHTPIRRVGAPDGPIPTAKPMESQFLPSAASIANVVLEVV
jgi:pyruvate dehydrogenase E1 component beta subunit